MGGSNTKPKLEAPPIIEVVCGVFFPPIAALDPIFVGGWWREIKREYPTHHIQPAVTETSGIVFAHGAGALRSWLVSQDDEWVIQIQPDRFYVNWRKRSERGYPRFSGEKGVLERVLRELRRFRDYCSAELKADIAITSVEVAKVDLIVEDTHWKGKDDLASIVPVIADVSRFARQSDVELNLNIIDPRADGPLYVGLSLSMENIRQGQLARAVRIDTRCARRLASPADHDVRAAFASINDDLNAAFFGLLSPDALGRFENRKPSK